MIRGHSSAHYWIIALKSFCAVRFWEELLINRRRWAITDTVLTLLDIFTVKSLRDFRRVIHHIQVKCSSAWLRHYHSWSKSFAVVANRYVLSAYWIKNHPEVNYQITLFFNEIQVKLTAGLTVPPSLGNINELQSILMTLDEAPDD